MQLVKSDLSEIKSLRWRPLSKILFWLFTTNFVLLGWLGSQHAEEPFILLSRICTIIYFSYFIIFLPLISKLEMILFSQPLSKLTPSYPIRK
jgi:ubiquinol-cytochrome c reductase cytochrome b subunit